MRLRQLLIQAGTDPAKTMVMRHAFRNRLPTLHKIIHQVIVDDPEIFDAWQQFQRKGIEK